MDQASDHIISYATPTPRRSRFGHVKTIFPFSLGLLLGGTLSLAFLIIASSKFTYPYGLWTAATLLCAGVILTAVFAVIILLLIGCFSDRTVQQIPPLESGKIGMASPVLASGIHSFAVMACAMFPMPLWLEHSTFYTLWGLVIVMAFGAPFLLVQWREASSERRWVRRWWKVSLTAVVLLLILWAIGIWETRTMVVKVAPSEIPFSSEINMNDGDAIRYKLPSGKVVAVWCERRNDSSEQRTASGLKTAWGEQPFHQPDLIMKPLSGGGETDAGWDSYIRQGSVITTGSETSEYILFVDHWKFSIIEDLKATSSLPVTIKVVPSNGD